MLTSAGRGPCASPARRAVLTCAAVPLESGFCLHELVTTSAPDALHFYAGLWGWRRREAEPASAAWPAWFACDGHDRTALRELRAAEAAHGECAHWRSYVSVESADRCAARALELGGHVVPRLVNDALAELARGNKLTLASRPR